MKQWLFAATVSIFSTVLSAQNITSTFDSNAEGWTILNNPSGAVSAPTYNPTGGSAGGCISKFEGAFSLPGFTLYFVAPPKFLGNKSRAYGKKLSFDIKSQRSLSDPSFGEDNIVLEGAGITLFYNIQTPATTWTHIECPLVEGNNWLIGSRNGPALATKSDIQKVLCNITRIWIRCEYIRGADEGFLDNVLLEMEPPCFTTNNQDLTLCNGQSIVLNNKNYSATGVYTDTIKNPNPCSLLCDSIIHLTLKVLDPITTLIDTTICEGSFVKIGNSTYNQSGTYKDILRAASQCDSTVTTRLTVVTPIRLPQNFTICQGDMIKVGSQTYNRTGTFIDTFKNTRGCDSLILTTHLTVNPLSVKSQNLTICQGNFIQIGSKTYNRAGVFIDTLKNFTLCDSILTTNLTVNTPSFKTQNISICQGNSIRIGSKTYNKTGIFTDTLKNFTLCDSILTTHLTILPPLSMSQNLSVCEGDFIKISTRMYNQTGVFKDTLQTASGCDSIVTTTLTVNKRYALTQNVSICPAGSFTVGNKTYTQAGTYRDTLHSLQRCDSVITTVLTIKTTATRTQTLAFCKGQSMKVGAKTYTQTGVYRDTFRAASGCDSVVVTDLTVNMPTSKQQNLTICQGEMVKIGNKTYTQSGVFTDTLKNFTQCDSVITTHLTVIPPLSISQILRICEGDFIKIGAKTYNKTGVFRDTLQALSGCDSVVTTDLKVFIRYTRTQNVTICPTGSYRINFKNYTQAGTYRDTLFSRDHCDSVVTTVLSVQNAITYTQDIAFCNGNTLKIGSKMYSRTGTYRDTIRSFSGCDSVITTNLTVNMPSFKTLNATICQGESFTVGNKTYTQSGTFTDILKNFTHCDSTITTKLTVIPPLSKSQNLSICAGDFIKIGLKTYNKTGIFKDTLTSFTGCDSVVTTHLTVNTIYSKTQNLTICEGNSIKVGNKIYTRTGIFNDTLKTITGCDSILTTNLGVYAVFVSSQSLELCEGGFIKVGNKTYNKSGIFTDTLTSKSGCDSIIFTILKVSPHISRIQTVSICPNTSLKIGTHTYTVSGTYRDTLKTIFGCDSLVTTVLKVQPVASFIQNIALCSGQTFKMGLRTYTQTGVYRDTLRTHTGCDSLVTTHLTINTVIFKIQNLTICEGEFVRAGGRIYLQSGTFKDTLKAIGGCDSIVTTNITVIPLTIRRIDTTICGHKNLVINNKSYTQTGLFKQSIARVGKCDSVVQISLTVTPLAFKRNDITLCPNDTIFINGRVLKQAGVYRDTIASVVGCPQVVETSVQNSALRINAGADITLEVGDSTRLSPAIPTGTHVLWHWKADKALSCVDCPNPIIKPLETTVFRVEATDTASDCTVRDDIRVIVKSCTSLFLPTSFSPNDDGHNDYFTLFAAGCVRSVKKMMVFNRWGALIFSKENFLPNNEQDGWDGTFQGKALPSDVYTYLIEFEVGNGKMEKVWGDVTLMK